MDRRSIKPVTIAPAAKLGREPEVHSDDDTKVSELSGSRDWTIYGVEREFAPIERLEDTAAGI